MSYGHPLAFVISTLTLFQISQDLPPRWKRCKCSESLQTSSCTMKTKMQWMFLRKNFSCNPCWRNCVSMVSTSLILTHAIPKWGASYYKSKRTNFEAYCLLLMFALWSQEKVRDYSKEVFSRRMGYITTSSLLRAVLFHHEDGSLGIEMSP